MLCLLALIAAASAAQPPATAPPVTAPPVIIRTPEHRTVDADTLAAAHDLLTASGFDANLERTMLQMGEAQFLTVVAAMEQQRGVQMPVELKNRMRLVVRNHLGELADAIRPTALSDAAKIYARYFTADELRELHRLQTMPVMVKFQRILPDIAAELGTIGSAEAARRMGAVEQAMQAELRAWLEQEGIDAPPPSES